MNELKDISFSLKIRKGPGYDKTSFNTLKKCFDELFDILKAIYKFSLEKEVFPEDLKIARVLLFLKLVTVLNWETIDQYHCFHAFPKTFSII